MKHFTILSREQLLAGRAFQPGRIQLGSQKRDEAPARERERHARPESIPCQLRVQV